MRFIELTESESGETIIVNVARIDLMYRFDNKTVLRIASSDIGVNETPDEIMLKIRG